MSVRVSVTRMHITVMMWCVLVCVRARAHEDLTPSSSVSNGDLFRGNFYRGQLAEGTLTYVSDGRKYKGKFVDNLPEDALGTLTYKNGNKYEGSFKAGKMHCDDATWIFKDHGERLVRKGVWVNGVRKSWKTTPISKCA